MCEFVVLRSGLVIPTEACRLPLDLESRGIQLAVDGLDIIVEGNHVTDEDIEQLRRWKPHVRMLLRHVADDSHLFDQDALIAPDRRTA